MKVTQKQLDKILRQLDHIIKVYKKKYSKDDKRDWRTYEQRLAHRIKTAAKELEPVIQEAYSMIGISTNENRGRPPEITIPQKVLLILIKNIFQLSNRKMANLLALFSMLTGIDTSYKTVERAYSDELVRMTIHNMFIILTKRKGIENSDLSGDGTGYSLTITKHYRNEREKQLKNPKNGKETLKTKKIFAYSFSLMDLDTKMYVGCGVSMKSEKEAYKEAVRMANSVVCAKSVRLDKYFSDRTILKDFHPDTKIYIIPKSNATIKGPPEWKEILLRFITNIFSYLSEYYKRNNSESGISTDKRTCGWKIWQRRPDRIHTAVMCTNIWHNLMLIG
jgi:transposase